MKTFIKLVLAVSLSLSGISESYAQWGNKKVTGNGNVTTQNVRTGDYEGVKVAGSMNVHLERGTEGNITVTTDENLQEYITIEVNGGILEIRIENNVSIRTNKGIHIMVPFQEISSVALTGSGDIDSKDVIKNEAMELVLTGSGDIKLALDSGSVDAKITGSGDMELSGSASNLEIKITGSGDFEANALQARAADVSISGSGNAMVTVNESIKARVNGSGDVHYSGNPEKSDTKVSGSGTIKSM
jgi:hypothetical protein